MPRLPLLQIVQTLQARYGEQKPPTLIGLWEMILWENVAYLADDDRRLQAFKTLKKQIGFRPMQILSAADEALLEVTRHGIMAEQSAAKLRQCAQIVLEEFDGDLRPVLKLPLAKAKKALQQFPGMGEPGAEKLLLFTRTHPVLALESNGLRVLLRVRFGELKQSYSALYRRVQQYVAADLTPDCAWLIQAHLLLRRHGQELCRRSKPLCNQCPLIEGCTHGQE